MRRWLLVVGVIVIVVLVDQITKQIVSTNLALYESYTPIAALEPVFQITRTFNTGAAFGLLPQGSDFFLIIAVIVVAAMLYFYPRIPDEGYLTRFAMGLVCGGAIGNALDRLQHGHVIDFIHYQIPNVVSNVSNLADHAIVIGVLLILFDSWRLERREEQRAAQAAAQLPRPQPDELHDQPTQE
ncbi:MAG: signal peptidase II [Anaerolineae bacterium]